MKFNTPHQPHHDIPRHVAIIMDGNGRWAESRGLARHVGHEQGAKTAEDIIRYAKEVGIAFVTLYAFSSENWQRPQLEINAVMSILERYLREDASDLVKNDIRIKAIGNVGRLPEELAKALVDGQEKTAQCKTLTITLALSYGAWEEIADAVRALVANNTDPSAITEDLIRRELYTKDLPDPDLLIRTGGELRLSNFLLLQLSYSELYFCRTLWPDFQRSDFSHALANFAQRKRRYGGVI